MTTLVPNYIEKQINDNYCPLSRDEEIALIIAHRNGNTKAMSKIINAQMKSVVAIARAYADNQSPIEDCIQEGFTAFPQAVMEFDITRGTRFFTFVSQRVRAAIQLYVFQNDTVRTPMNVVKGESADKRKKKKEEQSDAELNLEYKTRRSSTCSLDTKVGDSETTYGDLLTHDDDEPIILETNSEVKQYLSYLTPEQLKSDACQMLLLYCGFYGDTMSLEEVGKQYNCTRQNVDIKIKKLLKRIREKHELEN